MTFRIPLLSAVLLFLGLSAPQARELYTRPSVPARETLDQLNLKLQWKLNIPMASKRDDFESIRILDDQILIQTRSGGVFLHDAKDGSNIWRRFIDPKYHASCPPGFNKKYVFVVRGTKLHALDRATGANVWSYNLPNVPIVAPVADDSQFYYILGEDRLHAYRVPHEVFLEERTEKKYVINPLTGVNQQVDQLVEVAPTDYFEARIAGSVGYDPIYILDVIAVASENGKLSLMSPHTPKLLKDFQSKGELSAPLNWQGDFLYWGTTDFSLTCIDLKSVTTEWTHQTGGAILKRPETTEEDVYVIADRVGLIRLERMKGRERWVQRDIKHYFASNKTFVYGLNGRGEMVVLDRKRGTKLGKMDASKFTYLISNDHTDRIYLAASDGLIVCLHDKEYAKPMIHKTDPVYVKVDPTKTISE